MRAIIGSNGLVGSNLVRQAEFDARFNSSDIHWIGDRRFDLIVSAAPSATMWLANSQPEADYAKTMAFLENLGRARTGRLVVISTIAVFDDLAAGYDEGDGVFEVSGAYGKHRRMIETFARERFDKVHVLRLPALFGPGLKKNFVFDMLNPVPSFLKPEAVEALLGALDPAAADLVRAAFEPDPATGMLRYRRETFHGTPNERALIAALEGQGRTARFFTNSDSAYQYYNLGNLWRDIERCVALDIPVLNVCSEPLRAAEIYEALFAAPFRNSAPVVHREDVRSRHAAAWGGAGPYLYSAGETLDGLRGFVGGRLQ